MAALRMKLGVSAPVLEERVKGGGGIQPNHSQILGSASACSVGADLLFGLLALDGHCRDCQALYRVKEYLSYGT